jgi:hypothetical protein
MGPGGNSILKLGEGRTRPIHFSNWEDPVEGQFENEIGKRSVEPNLKMKLGWTPWDPGRFFMKIKASSGLI